MRATINKTIRHLQGTSAGREIRNVVGDANVIRVQRVAARPFRRSLTGLANVYWSDKASRHNYTSHYQRHLCHLRRKPIKLLEIGIGGYETPTRGGASLRMWRDYFRRGEIHGIDIYEKRIDLHRMRAHQGDQSDRNFLDDFSRQWGPFDVIVDDGSHINAHIRISFEALFIKHLKPGGMYAIEDMATAYNPEYGGGGPGASGTSAELVKQLVDDVNRTSWSANGHALPVAAVHVYDQLALIEKSGSTQLSCGRV